MNRFTFLFIFCISLSNHQSSEATPGAHGLGSINSFQLIYGVNSVRLYKAMLLSFGTCLSLVERRSMQRSHEYDRIMNIWAGLPDTTEEIPSDSFLDATPIEKGLKSQTEFLETLLMRLNIWVEFLEATDIQKEHREYVSGLLDETRSFYNYPVYTWGARQHREYFINPKNESAAMRSRYSGFQAMYNDGLLVFKTYLGDYIKVFTGVPSRLSQLAHLQAEFNRIQGTPADAHHSPIVGIVATREARRTFLLNLMSYIADQLPSNDELREEFQFASTALDELIALES